MTKIRKNEQRLEIGKLSRLPLQAFLISEGVETLPNIFETYFIHFTSSAIFRYSIILSGLETVVDTRPGDFENIFMQGKVSIESMAAQLATQLRASSRNSRSDAMFDAKVQALKNLNTNFIASF